MVDEAGVFGFGGAPPFRTASASSPVLPKSAFFVELNGASRVQLPQSSFQPQVGSQPLERTAPMRTLLGKLGGQLQGHSSAPFRFSC